MREKNSKPTKVGHAPPPLPKADVDSLDGLIELPPDAPEPEATKTEQVEAKAPTEASAKTKAESGQTEETDKKKVETETKPGEHDLIAGAEENEVTEDHATRPKNPSARPPAPEPAATQSPEAKPAAKLVLPPPLPPPLPLPNQQSAAAPPNMLVIPPESKTPEAPPISRGPDHVITPVSEPAKSIDVVFGDSKTQEAPKAPADQPTRDMPPATGTPRTSHVPEEQAARVNESGTTADHVLKEELARERERDLREVAAGAAPASPTVDEPGPPPGGPPRGPQGPASPPGPPGNGAYPGRRRSFREDVIILRRSFWGQLAAAVVALGLAALGGVAIGRSCVGPIVKTTTAGYFDVTQPRLDLVANADPTGKNRGTVACWSTDWKSAWTADSGKPLLDCSKQPACSVTKKNDGQGGTCYDVSRCLVYLPSSAN